MLEEAEHQSQWMDARNERPQTEIIQKTNPRNNTLRDLSKQTNSCHLTTSKSVSTRMINVHLEALVVEGLLALAP